MGIDWFTLVAQVVNFLILVVALWLFLFKRIVRSMDEREQRIASRFEAAESREQEADRTREELDAKRRELDEKQEELLAEAREKADKRRDELIEQARTEAERIRNDWLENIERQKTSFLTDLRERAGRQVCSAVEYALADLADEKLEHRAVDAFLTRLRESGEEPLKALRQGMKESGGTCVVRSAFDLPDDRRDRVEKALAQRLPEEAEIEFQRDGDLICGIEVEAAGRRLAWSIADYLQGLRERIEQTFSEQHREEEAGGEGEQAPEPAGQSSEDGR